MVLCKSIGIFKEVKKVRVQIKFKKPSPEEVKEITSASQRLPIASYAKKEKKNIISGLKATLQPNDHVDIPGNELPFGHVMNYFYILGEKKYLIKVTFILVQLTDVSVVRMCLI